MEYLPTIGLEVHVQLNTRTKIFCACSADYAGSPPNTHVCSVCLGYPGCLPVLGSEVVRKAVQVVRALEGTVGTDTRFDRKNYFYPDMPKAYQISQFDRPIGREAALDVAGRRIRIERIHMEEDAGKLVHAEDGATSLVDLNRAGIPLLEIVSAPELRSPEEAREYLEALREVLVFLDASDCNMEEGSLRCDANVSLAPRGAPLGTRVEIKNLNTFKGVARSLAYEIERHRALLEDGEEMRQETRLWDDAAGRTRLMRVKEDSEDYRYFPDPDLPPLKLDRSWIEEVAAALPELPAAMRARMCETYGLSDYDARVLTRTPERAAWFETAARAAPENPKAVCNWLTTEYLGRLGDTPVGEGRVAPEHLGALVRLVDDGEVNGKQAKQVFEVMCESGRAPEAIRDELGLSNVTDTGALRAWVQEAMAAHPDSVQAYRGGKKKALGFLVGAVMKASKGAADPREVSQVLREELEP